MRARHVMPVKDWKHVIRGHERVSKRARGRGRESYEARAACEAGEDRAGERRAKLERHASPGAQRCYIAAAGP